MSQQILLVGSTKRLVLSSGQAMRMPIYGNSFTKMRIGLRCSFPGTSTITGTPQLVIGMCSGTSGYADALTDNFVGVRSTSSTWPIFGTPGVNAYYGSIANWKVTTKVGATITTGASSMGGLYVSAEELIRCVLVLQIEKGSPNYTMRLLAPNSTGAAQTDVSDSQLVQLMELDDTLSSPSDVVANYSTRASNNTIAADEVGGDLNSICIFWDKISVPLYIEDVQHRLIAA